MHHWHSQSYSAARWNAASSLLIPMWAWAVTKPNHHHHLQARAQSDPTCKDTEQVKIETSYKKVAALERASKCFYISTFWGLITTNTAININTLGAALGNVGNRLVLVWESQQATKQGKWRFFPPPSLINQDTCHADGSWQCCKAAFSFSPRWGMNNLN